MSENSCRCKQGLIADSACSLCTEHTIPGKQPTCTADAAQSPHRDHEYRADDAAHDGVAGRDHHSALQTGAKCRTKSDPMEVLCMLHPVWPYTCAQLDTSAHGSPWQV